MNEAASNIVDVQTQHAPGTATHPNKNIRFALGIARLTPEILNDLANHPSPQVVVTEEAWARVEQFRGVVETHLKARDKVAYGINTGFGFLSDVRIADDQLEELQQNIIRSHACGVGRYCDPEISRAILILRAHTFLLGYSGVSRPCVEAILGFLFHDILPLIPQKGSVGASGDLAPLAHVALALLGEGQVYFRGKVVEAATALKESGLTPYSPKAKEGLALINGTHFMTAIAGLAWTKAKSLMDAANAAACLSLDAFRGSLTPFHEDIHRIRPQSGQVLVASQIRMMMTGDDSIMKSHENCGKIQDPYCFRCIPQVHGATYDTLVHIYGILERELNSVTDNPLVFENGKILSGGNFHGQPIAFAMDFLAIAVAELASISERRVEKLTNPTSSGLPAFLVENSGLNSGFMIPHVVAAALVSENKVLCHPASVDSVPTSAAKEDHVSMGSISAVKAHQVLDNVSQVLAIEMLSACQGLDLLAPLFPAPFLNQVYQKVRSMSQKVVKDRSLHKDIENVALWLSQGGITKMLEA